MLNIAVVKGYLPDTAKGMKHARAQAMRKLVEGMVTSQGDEIVMFDVEMGEALIQTKNDATLKLIQEQFNSMDNVKVAIVNAVEHERKKNIAAQEKANKMRASRKRGGAAANS